MQAPNGTRQRLVGPHFDAQGKFVPQHYEAAQKPKLHGYFADQEQKRQQHQPGYAEPTPNYTTPLDPGDLKPIEGR